MKVGDLIRVRTHDSPWSDPMIIMSAPSMTTGTVQALHPTGQLFEVFTSSALYDVQLLSKKS